MDKKEFKLQNLNIGKKILKKQGTDLNFKQNYPEFLAKRKKNSRLVQTKRTLIFQFKARARDRPCFYVHL